MSSEEEGFQVALRWPLENSLENIYVNQFSIAEYGHEVILLGGSFLPTGLANKDIQDEDVKEFFEAVVIKPEVKIIMTANALEQLYHLLRNHIEKRKLKTENGGDNG